MPDHLSPELAALRDQVAAFVAEELRPLEDELDPVAPVPRAILLRVAESSRARGLFSIAQPAALGGGGAGPLAITVVREGLARSGLRLASHALGPHPGVLETVSERLRKTHLEPTMRGEKRSAFAFTEPDDAERPTFARRAGDELFVTGRKSYVTGGASADFVCVLVNVEAAGEQPRGTAMVVIDMDSPGISIEQEFRSLDGSGHVSLRFEEVRVPLVHVIGKIGEGMPRALDAIGGTRLAVSATVVGMSLWAIEVVQQHLLAPHRSGQALGSREGVRLRYAEARIETYAARSMLYRTASLAEAGEDVRNEGMATKVFCSEVAGRTIDTAVQLLGGKALVHGHPLERAYREIRTYRLAEGASDILRINLARGALEKDAGRL